MGNALSAFLLIPTLLGLGYVDETDGVLLDTWHDGNGTFTLWGPQEPHPIVTVTESVNATELQKATVGCFTHRRHRGKNTGAGAGAGAPQSRCSSNLVCKTLVESLKADESPTPVSTTERPRQRIRLLSAAAAGPEVGDYRYCLENPNGKCCVSSSSDPAIRWGGNVQGVQGELQHGRQGGRSPHCGGSIRWEGATAAGNVETLLGVNGGWSLDC
ncbi:hypothetical protein EsH8_VIII_000599 [Colletotrichum jinshuiense]